MNKLTSLTDAVASIEPGSHIALPGFAITRCAMAFAHEVIRQKKDHLTLSQCVGAMDADILVGAGMADRLIYGGGSLDRFGRLNCVNRGIETGTLKAEEYSSLSITFRYLAGSLGIPFIPIRSLQGSDLINKLHDQKSKDVATTQDPFTGDHWLALKPLLPDVAIAIVAASDEEGNAWINGPHWDNAEQIRASKRTIVIADEIVSTETIRQNAEKIVVPGFVVSHVVHVPFAAHPTSMFAVYDYDAEHIKHYASATQSPEMFTQYLEAFVTGVANHEQYLQKVGGEPLLEAIKADPEFGY
jgi:acyl CoA:acetate/3-ketoacid CoA transferase alpha subunit